MKKLIKQLKFDLSELKRLKKEMKRFNVNNKAITLINGRIEDIKLIINILKKTDLIHLTEEQQDYITKLLILNSDFFKSVDNIINIKLD